MPNMSVDILRQNLTNPARTYLWEVVFPVPVGGGDSTVMSVRCQSTQKPSKSFGDSILVPFQQTGGVKYPGKLTFDHTWECVFVEGEDKAIFNAINGWMEQIVNTTTGIGVGDENVKQDVYLNLINTKGVIYQKIKLVGCYPQNIAAVDLAYEGDGEVKYTTTWSYDYWVEA